MAVVTVSMLPRPDVAVRDVEVVERKGLGHPDSICDGIAEAFGDELCRYYRERYGAVLHYNVDKVLLAAGQSIPAFGGGQVLEPIRLFLAGRATSEVRGEQVPLEAIARKAVHGWCARNLHAVDPQCHVDLTLLVRPSSPELVELFARRPESGSRLANDTSIGVGYAPLTPLESAVLAVENTINSGTARRLYPAIGEDVKVMGVRRGEAFELTVAVATVDAHMEHIADYEEARRVVADMAERALRQCGIDNARIVVNAADDIAAGSVYLTVTGTSGECGDDGEAGRGNRANGLITPGQPMSIEATMGKNPVTHVGRLYNVAATRIANAVVTEVEPVAAAQCLLVSRIGHPIDEPQVADVAVNGRNGAFPRAASGDIERIVRREIENLPALSEELVQGTSLGIETET